MGFKCGNCGNEFSNRKEWLDHIADVHGSYFLEGEQRDVDYHEKKLQAKVSKGDSKAAEILKAKNLEM